MELILGFGVGFFIGCFFALVYVRTGRRTALLKHLPDLPYLLLLYLLLTVISVVIGTPSSFRLLVSGMVGVEGGQMLMARRFG